jgi:DNA invertase Pin-like site-specific DNA recombinase
MSLIGYARVSTPDQSVDAQTAELRAVGCERIFCETATGADPARPELASCLNYLRAGDTLVVVRLDRLGRSLTHLVTVVEQLRGAEVGLRSLHEAIDTTTPAGRMVLGVFAALAEFERELISERTRAGLAAAKARGAVPGRPRAMSDEQVAHARALVAAGASKGSVARTLGVGRSTLYRALAGADR